MALISIILSVFNAEKTLNDAFDSILNQDFGFENLEVIFVDDKSTDNSVEIIKNFSESYENVKLFCLEENSGFAGKPRNVGMENATADYLMFLDPDDVFLENACSVLYENITKNDLDMVSGNYVKVLGDKEYPNVWSNINLTEGQLDIASFEEEEKILYLNASVWTKIFRKDLIIDNDITFPVGVPGQDLVFVDHALLKAKGIRFIDTVLTRYVQRTGEDGSVTLNRTYKLLLGYIKAYTELYSIIKDNNEKYVKYAVIHLNFWSNQFALSTISDEEKIKLLDEAYPLYEEFNNKGFKLQKRFKQFFEKVLSKDYMGAIESAKEVSLTFEENESKVIDMAKNKDILILFFGLDVEIGGLAKAVYNRSNLLADNGYKITLLNIDDLKDFNFISNHHKNIGYLDKNIEIINIYDYFSKKSTLDGDNKKNSLPIEEYGKKIGDYFVVKETNIDQSISIKYYECETLETCFFEMLVKEDLYIDNCLAAEITYLNKKVVNAKYFTPDGFNYLVMDYRNKDFQLNYREEEPIIFKNEPEFVNFFVSEICSNKSSKPFLISDCSSNKPSIKNISSELAYKIGNVHSNPYKVYPYCFGSRRRNISALNECDYLDRVVVLTESAKFDFEYEFDYKKFVVIPNLVLDEDSKFNAKDYTRVNKTISIFSRISPEKNLSDSIYALKLILKKHDDVVLKIFGRALKPNEIKEKEKLEKLADNLEISEAVKFMGHTNEADLEMANSLFTFWVSNIEGLGMSLLESMLNGTPLVSYDVNYGPRDVIVNNVNGIIVNQFDIKSLADAAIFLLENPEKANEMGILAREHILRNFSPEAVLKKWEYLFKDILVEEIIDKNAMDSPTFNAKERKGSKNEKYNLRNANDLVEKKDKKSKIRGKRMSIMNKFLSLSNSFKFYKKNYGILKKKNVKLADENRKLKAKNKRLNDKLEKLGQYYQEKYQKQLADNQLVNKSLENELGKE